MVSICSNRQEVIERIEALAPELRVRGVQRLALFGSYSRNTQREHSDIDLLVEFLPGQKSYDNFFAVCELLEDSLQRRVELVTVESLSPHIGPHILREAEDVIVAD
jgi:predicted nucleotidyltransferase